MPRFSAFERTRESAASADSFITSPSWPVRIRFLPPGIFRASIKRMSPPVGVHARPVTTPGSPFLSLTSEKYTGGPRNFSTFFGVITIFLSESLPSAANVAIFLIIPPILRSRFLTPASRVYSLIIFMIAFFWKIMLKSLRPFSSFCLGIR